MLTKPKRIFGMNSSPTFGRKLRQLRKASPHSQAKLAEMLGVSEQALRNYEKGKLPTAKVLLRIPDVFGQPLEAFFAPDPDPAAVAPPSLEAVRDLLTQAIGDAQAAREKLEADLKAALDERDQLRDEVARLKGASQARETPPEYHPRFAQLVPGDKLKARPAAEAGDAVRGQVSDAQIEAAVRAGWYEHGSVQPDCPLWKQAQALGIVVISAAKWPRKRSSWYGEFEQSGPFILLPGALSEREERWVIAHEMGHFFSAGSLYGDHTEAKADRWAVRRCLEVYAVEDVAFPERVAGLVSEELRREERKK